MVSPCLFNCLGAWVAITPCPLIPDWTDIGGSCWVVSRCPLWTDIGGSCWVVSICRGLAIACRGLASACLRAVWIPVETIKGCLSGCLTPRPC